MAISFRYWNECVELQDMEELWMNPEVRKEWTDAGEAEGHKVHLSRDPDGQAYLTQTEMKAVAAIVIQRHFQGQIDLDMICALAEVGSDRQLLAQRYNRKTKETRIGLMQLLPKTAEWLFREMGYRTYEIEGETTLLHRPFTSVYLGCAYAKCLFGFEGKQRNEEFVVRSYHGGTKKAGHKSTLHYWHLYLSAKECLLPNRGIMQQITANHAGSPCAPGPSAPISSKAGDSWMYWDTRVSTEDMNNLWNHPDVRNEWTKSNERQGNVRFSHDAENRPYLSRAEVKAVSEIIVSKYFNTKEMRPELLAAMAELVSMRFVNGVDSHSGIMGIEYPTALWLYKDLGFKAYVVNSVEDLSNPFLSIYFGAAYWSWLSKYEGRERSLEFIVQAYLGGGPENVSLQETGKHWTKFQEALTYYGETKRVEDSCSIM